jgi:hypothetical protein
LKFEKGSTISGCGQSPYLRQQRGIFITQLKELFQDSLITKYLSFI